MVVESLILLHNCRVVKEDGLHTDEVWMYRGKIISAEEAKRLSVPRRCIDCLNRIVSPGFIDVQVNGGFGYDFSATEELEKAVEIVSSRLVESGCTAYVPTLVTSGSEDYHKRVPKIRFSVGGAEGATVLGSHLEGPFISVEKRGCHDTRFIKGFGENPREEIVSTYGPDLSHVLLVTLAPELPGSTEAIRFLSDQGIIVSLGHSQATYDQGVEAMMAGACSLTHLFCAMNAFGHKEPSLPGLLCADIAERERKVKLRHLEAWKAQQQELLSGKGKNAKAQARGSAREGAESDYGGSWQCGEDKPAADLASSSDSCREHSKSECDYRSFQGCAPFYFGLIADYGVHTHATAIRIASKLYGRGLCLITDANAALGLPNGDYVLGSAKISVEGSPRRAVVSGTSTLAGVVTGINECIRFYQQVTKCPLWEAVNAASLTPARCLGIADRKGKIAPGYDADLVIISEDFQVYQTWVNGQLAFQQPPKHALQHTFMEALKDPIYDRKIRNVQAPIAQVSTQKIF